MELTVIVTAFLLAAGVLTGAAVLAVRWGLDRRADAVEAASRLLAHRSFTRHGGGNPAGWTHSRPRLAVGLWVLVGLAAVASVAVLVGKLVEDVTNGDGLTLVDRPVYAFIAGHRTSVLTAVMRVATVIGGPTAMAAGALVAGMLIWVAKRQWAPLLLLGVASAGIVGLTTLFKAMLERPRPPLRHAIAGADGYGFPSGHAATAAAVLGILAFICTWWVKSWAARVAVWTAASMVTALVGLSRIYLGVHWASDVVGGWLFGVLWLVIVVASWIAFIHRDAVRC